ncbi:MAG: 16S rRNA (adenine(1518)-N(6)/adenine(1519)-N(6))-dimethyltransferase RsmA [Pyrinomonadaceae bacterium]
MNVKKSKNKTFAKKSFGQNFLVDRSCVSKIISALNPLEKENIIEIGPGRGALTEKILESGANLTALELDRDLIPFLQNQFYGCKNLNLIEADALKVDYSSFKNQNPDEKLKLVANLPYYISTAILQHLTNYQSEFEFLIVMLQREVVERITATPGSKERGFLTVLIEASFETQKLFDVSPDAFYPVPKVWSAVIRLIPKKINSADFNSRILFREVISAGFAQKRKTIFNNLKNYLKDKIETDKVLLHSEIETNRRAETLSVEEWRRIVEKIKTIHAEIAD